MTDEHCPECGAFGIVRREPCETVVVCPNDDCPRVIISVRVRAAFGAVPVAGPVSLMPHRSETGLVRE